MSEEEKTILEFIKINNKHRYCDKDDVDFLLNLIEKQQKELEQEKEKYRRLQNTEAFQECYISKDKIKEMKEFYINEHKNKNITLIPLENIIKNINVLLEEK